ncbi:MAG TPA: mechanosensitive ion channel domain-containing protein [Anaerolineae bacterium]|nr:mechanosensitive ion channel domain-containing protein [Anaerolineae bacterium]
MPDISVPAVESFVGTILRIGVIILLALLAQWLLRIAARRIERRVTSTVTNREHQLRLRTVIQVGYSLAFVVLAVFTILMILSALNVDIGPLVAGIGVVGLAVSLGAQSLIKDFIGGMLIFVEDQFAVGNVIAVGNVSGEVERITLRATYLRDTLGKLHIVPNGEIRIVSNLTAHWSLAVVDLSFAYDADMTAARQALQDAIKHMQTDETLKALLLDVPQIMEWNSLTNAGIQVRVQAKTLPGKQWAAMAGLRQYAVKALQSHNVRVSAPA